MTNNKIALVYDADYTLMNGYHPSAILENRGIDKEWFWKQVSLKQEKRDSTGAKSNFDVLYISQLLHEVRHGNLQGLTLDEIRSCGSIVDKMLYPGLPEFFEEIKRAFPQYQISHNIVSVGIEPLLRASVLGRYMDEIVGYTFADDFTPGPVIDELESTNSSAEKIPAVIGISYGKGSDRPEDPFEYSMKRMIYFGDGQTDIGPFKFVPSKGGYAVCVYSGEEKRSKAVSLTEKVNNSLRRKNKNEMKVMNADYSKGSELWNHIVECIADMDMS